MRRFFRFVGFVRFGLGVTVVAIGFLVREQLGEPGSAGLVLLGAAIGVSGTASVLTMVAFYLILPFGYIGVIWLTMDVWDGSYYTDTLNKYYGFLYFFWASGLIALPLGVYYQNKSWFFMVNNFALDEEPTDTAHPELFAFGIVDLTGSPYFAAATITEQGLILDRRNFAPVVLPWRWVTSIEPNPDADSRQPSAIVAMKNDNNEFLTLCVPWNEELLKLNSARLKHQ